MDGQIRVPRDHVEVRILMEDRGPRPNGRHGDQAVDLASNCLPGRSACSKDPGRLLEIAQALQGKEGKSREPGTHGTELPAGSSSREQLHDDRFCDDKLGLRQKQPTDSPMGGPTCCPEEFDPRGCVYEDQISGYRVRRISSRSPSQPMPSRSRMSPGRLSPTNRRRAKSMA